MPDMLIMKRIRREIRRKLPRPILRRIYRKQALEYIESLNPEYDPAKKTILAINHLFDQDLNALRDVARDWNFIIVGFAELLKGGKAYFSRAVRDIRAPYDAEPLENRLLFREECRLLFDRLRERFHPSLIVTANDNFSFIREFISVAHEYGVPTVILDKEGTISPHSFEAEAERARRFTPCISDHVFVWSRRQKAYWQKRNVPPEKITVIGQPRSDLFFRKSAVSRLDDVFDVKRPLVTMFSYFDDAYIPIPLARNGVSWKQMKTETQDMVRQLAVDHPEYNFIIKCHPQQLDIDAIRKKHELPNLKVVGGADIANELILKSELIIAFQTTAVIEAMFTGKRIIYTAWDTNYDRLKDDLLPFHDAGGIVIARSADDFRGVCNRFFSGDMSDFAWIPDDLAARDRFINEYFYKPDGHVCERFFEAIDEVMA